MIVGVIMTAINQKQTACDYHLGKQFGVGKKCGMSFAKQGFTELHGYSPRDWILLESSHQKKRPHEDVDASGPYEPLSAAAGTSCSNIIVNTAAADVGFDNQALHRESLTEVNRDMTSEKVGQDESETQNDQSPTRVLPLSETVAVQQMDFMDDDILFEEYINMPHEHEIDESSSEDSETSPLDSRNDFTSSIDEEVGMKNCIPAADDLPPEISVAASSPTALSCKATNSTDPDVQGFNIRKMKDFIIGGGDAIMFVESNLRIWQVILTILGLCHRYSLSAQGRKALIEATRLFAGPAFAAWDISHYELSKVFDAPDEVIKYTFYCEVCCKKLEESPTTKRTFRNHEAVCEQCLKNYQLSMNSPNYFINLDLQYQLKSLLSLPIVSLSLTENLKNVEGRLQPRDGVLTDVYDSVLYQKLVAETEPNSRLLTYIVNTDGAPLFNSSKRGFWPIQIIINELPPKIRFKHPLLVGLAVGKKEPSPDLMNIFFESFVDEANKLSSVGFELKMGEGNIVKFVLKPLACSVDSVARPILQNRLQFNGYHGCSWCYSVGVHTHGCMRFLMEESEPADRTHEDFVRDLSAVMKRIESSTSSNRRQRINVRGVKGQSIMTYLKGFDMIWGFVRDYLHADLAGVATQMINMWRDPECPIRLTRQQFLEVNERLMKMTPPHEVHRLVRPLVTEKAKWKASEWRSWLIFYSIPCLTGILPHYASQHFALFVCSIFILLKRSITEEELVKVESDLRRFVIIFELLYGEKYVTFNVHSLNHLVRSVKSCGPLWATSTFPFESAIRQLKQSVHGAKGVHEQMAKKSMHGIIIKNLVEEMEESPASRAFHRSLFARYSDLATVRRCAEGVVLIGHGHLASDEERLGCAQVHNGNAEIHCHKRCIKSGTVVSGVAYDRQHKSNDTMFRDKRGRFVQVLYLLSQNTEAFAKVSCYRSKQVVIQNCEESRARFEDTCGIRISDVIVDHLFILDERYITTAVIPVVDLKDKCVLMNVGGRIYVSTLPNDIEIQ